MSADAALTLGKRTHTKTLRTDNQRGSERGSCGPPSELLRGLLPKLLAAANASMSLYKLSSAVLDPFMIRQYDSSHQTSVSPKELAKLGLLARIAQGTLVLVKVLIKGLLSFRDSLHIEDNTWVWLWTHQVKP